MKPRSGNLTAIAFDFWGIIADMNPPMNEYLQVRNVPLEQYKSQIHELIVQHDLNLLSEKQFLEACGNLVGIKIPYPECRFTYQEKNMNLPLIEIIKKLKPKYKIAILSNNYREYSEEYIFTPGLDSLFDAIVLSYQVGHRKPSPEIYQSLINQLGVDSKKILFLDDEPEKLPEATKQGMKILLYKRGEAEEILTNLI